MPPDRENVLKAKTFAGIEIPPELKWSNFLNLYFIAFCAGSIVALPAVLQPAFLKDIINIPQEKAGIINSNLQNMSQIAWFLFVGIAGMFSDKVGRRILAIVGFIFCGISFILFVYIKHIALLIGMGSINEMVILTYITRFLLGIGIILAFPQTMTLVADYSYNKDRGKAMAYHGLTMSLGSILVFGVIAQLGKKMGLSNLFYISAGIGFAGLFATLLGVVDRMPEQKPKKIGIKKIFDTVIEDIALVASYVTTFVSRIDIVIISTFVIVWMVKVADKFGMTSIQATMKGGIILLVMSVATLLAWPIIGILLDKWGRGQVMILGLFLGGAGFTLIALTKNPFSSPMYLYTTLMGVGFSAATASASALTADASPKPLLGSVMGGLNAMQPLGAFIFLFLGGISFDKLGYWGPFALKGAVDILCGIWILFIRKRLILSSRENRLKKA
ncbi:MAG: MFS transporter [Candidatus Schekmanbacteria bacterium]|nr:MAG: MFS transporter [Candidatus Schekmanbacteria bacterium]